MFPFGNVILADNLIVNDDEMRVTEEEAALFLVITLTGKCNNNMKCILYMGWV